MKWPFQRRAPIACHCVLSGICQYGRVGEATVKGSEIGIWPVLRDGNGALRSPAGFACGAAGSWATPYVWRLSILICLQCWLTAPTPPAGTQRCLVRRAFLSEPYRCMQARPRQLLAWPLPDQPGPGAGHAS